MTPYKVISADSHIVEPPDLYVSRMDAKYRDRAPRLERRTLPDGRPYDSWYVDGVRIGTSLGNFVQAGRRFSEDPATIDFIGVWEDVMKAAYDPDAMLEALEEDGVWGAVIQTGQGVFLYRLPDSKLLDAICAAHNEWLAEFCQANPGRLRGIATLNVDDVEVGCRELERCAKMGLAGAFIPVAPLPDRPYRHPMYERLWATAQDLDIPLILHIFTPRGGVPGCEMASLDIYDVTAAARSTADHWVRYSLAAIIFAGVFDRYPRLRIGSIEHEAAWVPFWLNQMDWIYRERPNVFVKGWKSTEGLKPSEYWRRNSFLAFEEDEVGIELRHRIGVDNMMWGNDFPHAESTWPRSMELLDRLFTGIPDEERRKITSTNAAKLFKFGLS